MTSDRSRLLADRLKSLPGTRLAATAGAIFPAPWNPLYMGSNACRFQEEMKTKRLVNLLLNETQQFVSWVA